MPLIHIFFHFLVFSALIFSTPSYALSNYEEEQLIKEANERLIQIDKEKRAKEIEEYNKKHTTSYKPSGNALLDIILSAFFLMLIFIYVHNKNSEKKTMEKLAVKSNTNTANPSPEKTAANTKNTNPVKSDTNITNLEDHKNNPENNILLKRKKFIEQASIFGYDINNDEKFCPSCAEKIKVKAQKCKHCNHEFSNDDVFEEIKYKIIEFYKLNNKNYISNATKLIKSSNFQIAIRLLTLAIKHNIDPKNSYYLRAYAYSKISENEKALLDMNQSAYHGNQQAIDYLKKHA